MFSTLEAPAGAALSISCDQDTRLADLVPLLRRLAGRIARRWRGVERDDLLQIGLEAAWRASAHHDPARARLWTFVYPRARGAMLDACRAFEREPANDTRPLPEPADERPTPEQRLIMMEQQRRALARLKPLDRNLFQLCVIDGESLRAAAAKVGLEYKTAWVRMESAKRRLRSA